MRFLCVLAVTVGIAASVGFAAPTPGDKVGVFRGNEATALWLLDANGSGLFENLTVDRGFYFGGLDDPLRSALTGDWNGSGTRKVGVRHGCFFIVDYNGNGQWDGTAIDRAFYQCLPADAQIVVGDWSGDHRDKLGFFSNGVFHLDANGSGAFATTVVLGQAGDTAVVGDWNGSGWTKVGVFRNGLWVLDYNGNGAWDGIGSDVAFFLGTAGDLPLAGDWNGDGRTKAGVVRTVPTSGNTPFGGLTALWVLDYNGNQQWDGLGVDRAYGLPGLLVPQLTPVLGDWNNDGRTKVGLFQSGVFNLDVSGDGSVSGTAYLGQAGDIPIVGRW